MGNELEKTIHLRGETLRTLEGHGQLEKTTGLGGRNMPFAAQRHGDGARTIGFFNDPPSVSLGTVSRKVETSGLLHGLLQK